MQPEDEEEIELNAEQQQTMRNIKIKLYVYKKLEDYIKQHMAAQRSKTLMALPQFQVNLKKLRDDLRFGRKNVTQEFINKKFPNERDIKFLTGSSLDEKRKRISSLKNIISGTLKKIREKKMKEEMVKHFGPILKHVTQVANDKYAVFPQMQTIEKKFSKRVINKNIKKGDLLLNLNKIRNCPEKRSNTASL